MCPKERCKVEHQKEAPHFSCSALDGGMFTMVDSRQLAGKYVVLLFYPGDFRTISAGEIQQFSERLNVEMSKFTAWEFKNYP